MTDGNLFRGLSPQEESEITDSLLEDKRVRIERITSWGQSSPIYDQSENEWVTLLQGQARILMVDSGETVSLERGDCLYLPAGRRHQVVYTSKPCLWLCFFWEA